MDDAETIKDLTEKLRHMKERLDIDRTIIAELQKEVVSLEMAIASLELTA